MLTCARRRARAQGVPFDLRPQDFAIPAYCPVFGIKLETRSDGGRGPAANSPTLDRIIPERGYVPGNVIVVSWKANRAKCDLTIAELRALADFYTLNQPKDSPSP